MAVAFSNIFMAHIEEGIIIIIIRQSKTKPREWKRYIDNTFSLWDSNRQEIYLFIEQAIKQFSSYDQIYCQNLRDWNHIPRHNHLQRGYIQKRLHPWHLYLLQADRNISVYTFHLMPGFIKGEALRLLRTNFSETMFQDNLSKFKSCLIKRGYPKRLIRTTLSEVNFASRQLALLQEQSAQMNLAFCHNIPTVTALKNSDA